MSQNFENSITKTNLMRAFAGESQARNRYNISASVADKNKLYVVGAIFRFTAEQEREHASIFYKHLSSLDGQNIEIEGAYPVNYTQSAIDLLNYAAKNEYEEHDSVYSSFAKVAHEEGFPKVAFDFESIAKVEKIHGDRFDYIAKLLKEDKLFVSDVSVKWMCLKCGYVFEGTRAPEMCPVCSHDKGYFVRLELAPYTLSSFK